MDSLSYEEQKWLDSRIRYVIENTPLKSNAKSKSFEIIKIEFFEWLNSIKNIDPKQLSIDNIQDTIDEMINSEIGKFFYAIAIRGFYCWIKIFQIDFIIMLESSHDNMNLSWKIDYDWQTEKYIAYPNEKQ